jgi:membrane protein YqaA with SNARE-associated domain
LKSVLAKLAGLLAFASQYLMAYGALGLFTIALLDSVMLPLPSGTDAVMLLLSTVRPQLMLLYAAAATLGSVIGCVLLYYISQRAGRRAMARFSIEKQARVKELIDRYDVLALLVACLLPPPFPFKLVVISAGVFRFNIWRFILAITAGRAFRFLLEGYIAVRYGEKAKQILLQYYPVIGLTLAGCAVLAFIGRNVWRRRAAAGADA